MSKPQRIKTEAKQAVYIPQSRDECAQAIDQIGRLQREILTTQAAMNDEIANITERFAGTITDKTNELKLLQDGVQAFCESHRHELTEGGKFKTGRFVTGEVQWRQRPPSVVVRGAESVIDFLKRHGLDRFVRTKEEINKEAILNEPAAVSAVAGISIKTGVEDFVITPFEQELS